MKKVEIRSGEFRFVGELLTEEAPETCKVLKACFLSKASSYM